MFVCEAWLDSFFFVLHTLAYCVHPLDVSRTECNIMLIVIKQCIYNVHDVLSGLQTDLLTYPSVLGGLSVIPRLHDEAGSTTWLDELAIWSFEWCNIANIHEAARRALDVEPASSCKRGIRFRSDNIMRPLSCTTF